MHSHSLPLGSTLISVGFSSCIFPSVNVYTAQRPAGQAEAHTLCTLGCGSPFPILPLHVLPVPAGIADCLGSALYAESVPFHPGFPGSQLVSARFGLGRGSCQPQPPQLHPVPAGHGLTLPPLRAEVPSLWAPMGAPVASPHHSPPRPLIAH